MIQVEFKLGLEAFYWTWCRNQKKNDLGSIFWAEFVLDFFSLRSKKRYEHVDWP